MTIEELKAFLAENKDIPEVIAVLATYAPKPELTTELVEGWIGTEEGAKFLQPHLDAYATKAVKSHDEKQAAKNKAEVDRRVAAEILKLHPEETPEQKQIRELGLKFEESEKARAAEALATQISTKAHEMGVDPIFVRAMNHASVDEAVVWMKKVLDRDKVIQTKTANELLASGAKPGSGNSSADGKPDISKMDAKQKFDYFKAEAEKREAAVKNQNTPPAK
jgi:hypothetical protein